MNVYDFLAHLRTLDIHLSAADGRLRVNAPKGAVTDEIKSQLSARKAEIIALLSDAEPLTLERVDGDLPLSMAQEHLWQLHRLTPNTLAYNMHTVFRLCGALNSSALEQALCDVVGRHQILRAAFPQSAENRPVQIRIPASSIVLKRVTSSAAELEKVISHEIQAPFDLHAGPLFRATLVELSVEDHVLILAMHHIISDGQSFGILFKDLAHAYSAACEERPVEWKPLPFQYADFAAWQRKWLESNAGASDRHFWLAQLSDEVPALELPQDHPHPLQTMAEGAYFDVAIESLADALNDLCRREGVTLFALAFSAFNVLLHRHSGQRDLLICTPVAGRDRSELNDLVGYFNNTLLLRNDLTTAITLRELLQHSQTLVMDALSHQMFPFREVANFQTVARTPLSRAMVVVQNADDISFQLPGIQSEKIPAFNHAVQYDLSLEVNVEGAGLRARLMYRKVLFQPETVQRLADKLVAILQEMLAHPENEVERIGTDRLPIKRGVSLATRPPYVAPRTDLEHKLAQIWQDVLELDDVGIHDGFFELGGQSLLALRLFTRIEQETGTHLPLATLFGTTTIAHLAQLIEGRSDSSSWDCLVPIQPNGTKTPFFCVHGIGGGVIGYRDLANFIGEEQPFFGLQAVGQDGSVPYDLSIEAMAARYVDVMRSRQPEGPYRIGGYCFGGVVAFEMARQLEKLGEHVSVLAIFEGGMADTMDTRVSLFKRMRAIWRNLPVWLKDYSGMSSGQLWNRMRSTLEKMSIKFGRNPEAQRRARVEETLDINVDDLPQRNVELTDLHLKAALEYKPPAYSGNLTLFRARNRSINEIVFGSLDPKMGWGAFAKEVKVIPVDGFHRNMHLAPYARSLAHELKKELDNDLR